MDSTAGDQYRIKGTADFWPTIERFARDYVALHPELTDAHAVRDVILRNFAFTPDWKDSTVAGSNFQHRFLMVALDAMVPPCAHGVKASEGCQACMLEAIATSPA
ncbi:MAG: hypothetical protein JWP44_4520 [Mucilaginibacter sp.]|nr:hypothetical protein [Mucilaginibacter sp.]